MNATPASRMLAGALLFLWRRRSARSNRTVIAIQ
jgi:hypothetical protein